MPRRKHCRGGGVRAFGGGGGGAGGGLVGGCAVGGSGGGILGLVFFFCLGFGFFGSCDFDVCFWVSGYCLSAVAVKNEKRPHCKQNTQPPQPTSPPPHKKNQLVKRQGLMQLGAALDRIYGKQETH